MASHPRGERFPPGETRREQQPAFPRRGRWRGAAPPGSGAARSPTVPGEGSACEASPSMWVPLGETSIEGNSTPSRGSLSHRFLILIPGKFVPARGRSCGSALSSWEGARLLRQRRRRQCLLASIMRVGLVASLPAPCLSYRLCQGTAGRGRQLACLFGVAYIWSHW